MIPVYTCYLTNLDLNDYANATLYLFSYPYHFHKPIFCLLLQSFKRLQNHLVFK